MNNTRQYNCQVKNMGISELKQFRVRMERGNKEIHLMSSKIYRLQKLALLPSQTWMAVDVNELPTCNRLETKSLKG